MMMAMACVAVAQRPVITAGSPGYMYTPHPTAYVYDSTQIYPNWMYSQRVRVNFYGNAFRSPNGVTVYGVAVCARDIEKFPYLWVYMMQDRLVDSLSQTTHCYTIDTVASALFSFVEHEPVSYADIQFLGGVPYNVGDTFTYPIYEFYFPHPIQVAGNRRFYLGISHSGWNVYNHCRKDNPYWPYWSFHGPGWLNVRRPRELRDPTCYDGLDSTWNLTKSAYPGLVDWECNRCTTQPDDPNAGGWGKYISRGFFAIIRPPEDSTRLLPVHEHPPVPGRVEPFRLTELDSAHATFEWDTFPPSDWGLVGVNVSGYELNYAPYMEDYSAGGTVVVDGGVCRLEYAFDSTVLYKARCRALSRHVCDIHDTVVGGEWSREVYFHTGVVTPDSLPLECRRVEGLRYKGMLNGRPQLEWHRGYYHDRFEVEYAAVGGGGWRRAGVTLHTEYQLRVQLDSSRYMVRVRAICDHHCPVHDTLMTGDWSDTVYIDIPSEEGVEPVGEAGRGLFDLAPNPASDGVRLEVAAEGFRGGVLSVADAAGREVLRRELKASERVCEFRVADLPAGTYFVTLTTKEGTSTRKLVVE